MRNFKLGAPRPPVDPVARWIEKRSTAIPSLRPEGKNGEADLSFLRSIVGRAKLVSLGEASHGNHEIFLLKRRVVQDLVSNQGFRNLLLETNAPDTRGVEDYLRTGQGTARQALSKLGGWMYQTEEVLGLIEWMREWNVAHPDQQLHVQGIDMQNPEASARGLSGYLEKVAPPLAKQLAGIDGGETAAELGGVLRTLRGIAEALEAGRDQAVFGLRGEPSEHARSWERANEDLALLSQYVEWQKLQAEARESGAPPTQEMATRISDARDRYMALNVARVMRRDLGERFILWAHDGHVTTAPTSQSSRPLGSLLKAALGDELVTLGTAIGKGEVRARVDFDPSSPPQPDTLAPSPAGGFDSFVASAPGDDKRFWLDLRGEPPANVRAALETSGTLTSVGAVYQGARAQLEGRPDPAAVTYDLLRGFDAIAYIENVTPSLGMVDETPEDRAALGWLRGRGSKEIVSFSPEAPQADLEPILEAVKGAQLIGLGEATHGMGDRLRITPEGGLSFPSSAVASTIA